MLTRSKDSRNRERSNGAAAARLAVRPPRIPRHDYYEGIPRLGVAAADTSSAIVRASFSPIYHSKKRFLGVQLRQNREVPPTGC
jgi:hypothetical protein